MGQFAGRGSSKAIMDKYIVIFQLIWYLVLTITGCCFIAFIIHLIFYQDRKRRPTHINQPDLTDFLHECIEEHGGDEPVWSARNRKEG